MSLLQNSNAISAGGYTIDNSLRFRQSASATLSRTPASASNRTTWTWSGWVKRGRLGTENNGLFAGRTSASATYTLFVFSDTNTLWFLDNGGTSLITTAVYRDPSAWYHIVLAVDTTQATASNRVKLYVNGSQITAFSTATYPTQNANLNVNSTATHVIGDNPGASQYFDGYMAEVNFIDGSAKTPSDFGETDTTTGVWKPKAYTGTYGTNGFYLKFSDIATTSGSNAGLGKDFSGNTNYWTTNNISVTSGTTYDAMIDSPTNASASGTQPVGNYATLNPLVRMTSNVGASVSPTISEGNLKSVPSANNNGTLGTFGVSSGKWYFEVNVVTGTVSNNVMIGISYNPAASLFGSGVGYEAGGNKTVNGTSSAYGSSTTTGDVIGIALDADSNSVTFYKNNVSQGAISYTPTDTLIYPSYAGGGGVSASHAFNFGQRPFTYTPPSGYKAICTTNLPDSTIVKGNKYMDATLYTGTNANQSINSYGFSPDLIWIKNRNNVEQHHLVDSVRGNNKFLLSNSTAAERTGSLNNGYNQVNLASTGFDIVSNGLNDELNLTGRTYVAWGWDANGAGSSNTSGSITSTVSVNTTAGFSIVTYTGTGANATVGHGLGVAPKLIIEKVRTVATGWAVYHASLGATQLMELNTTGTPFTSSTYWQNTTPTSTVFSIGTYGGVNTNGGTHVAYCWAEIAGFSKFGSFTGNGSSDGPFIFLGFRPKYVIIKCTNDISHWTIEDSSRSPYNVSTASLYTDTSAAELTTIMSMDMLSNGFKMRNVLANESNVNGYTYIYAAFSENPFKNSLAR